MNLCLLMLFCTPLMKWRHYFNTPCMLILLTLTQPYHQPCFNTKFLLNFWDHGETKDSNCYAYKRILNQLQCFEQGQKTVLSFRVCLSQQKRLRPVMPWSTSFFNETVGLIDLNINACHVITIKIQEKLTPGMSFASVFKTADIDSFPSSLVLCATANLRTLTNNSASLVPNCLDNFSKLTSDVTLLRTTSLKVAWGMVERSIDLVDELSLASELCESKLSWFTSRGVKIFRDNELTTASRAKWICKADKILPKASCLSLLFLNANTILLRDGRCLECPFSLADEDSWRLPRQFEPSASSVTGKGTGSWLIGIWVPTSDHAMLWDEPQATRVTLISSRPMARCGRRLTEVVPLPCCPWSLSPHA